MSDNLVRRLEHADANSVQRCLGSDIFGEAAARIRELEAQVEEKSDRIEELEQAAEVVSAEFEGDCWKALRRVLTRLNFDWSDTGADGLTADDAAEFIIEDADSVDANIRRIVERADAAEARRRKLEEALRAAAHNFDEIAKALDGLADTEDRPLRSAERIRAVATETRALLDQADGEKSDG